MIRRPPRSTLFPYTTALPISLLMEALPESRMVLLVRDPRDVVASAMDARSEGGWNYERNKKLYLEGRKRSSSKDPDAFAEGRGKRYLEGMGKGKEAYDAHDGGDRKRVG